LLAGKNGEIGCGTGSNALLRAVRETRLLFANDPDGRFDEFVATVTDASDGRPHLHIRQDADTLGGAAIGVENANPANV
jgi:hypothetical protein